MKYKLISRCLLGDKGDVVSLTGTKGGLMGGTFSESTWTLSNGKAHWVPASVEHLIQDKTIQKQAS